MLQLNVANHVILTIQHNYMPGSLQYTSAMLSVNRLSFYGEKIRLLGSNVFFLFHQNITYKQQNSGSET